MPSILNATTTNGLVTSADNSGSLQLQTNNGTTAVTIDTSQNVGIGGSPVANNQLTLYRSTFSQFRMQNATTGTGTSDGFRALMDGVNVTMTNHEAGYMAFETSDVERMRIQSNGFVGIATTNSSYPLQVSYSSNTGPAVGILDTTPQNGNTFIQFRNNATTCGNITSNGTNSTTYGTSSDYRLKENIEPMNNALAKVAQLKPVTYTWKADGSAGQGFIAHELQAVVPDCVVGGKDAVDADGNPQYQNVDTSYLVATLTAAIQELKAELDATKAEVQALKGVA